MKKEASQWSKNVRKAVIDKDMTLKQLAESIGYSLATVRLSMGDISMQATR